MADPPTPFRWNLTRPDQFGGLLDGATTGTAAWGHDLIACAGKVLARAGDADLYFVGRSADSLHDVLAGALRDTGWSDRLRRLPLSLGTYDGLTGSQRARLREILGTLLRRPSELSRGRDVAFVDIVAEGDTFGSLFTALERWCADEHANWPVIRRKLRFVGLTAARPTSPKTWRWWQQAAWTEPLPSSAIVNVSIDHHLFHYLGGGQDKTNVSFNRERWWDESVGEPPRDTRTRGALADAVAYTELGERSTTRAAIARGIAAEPVMREPWARRLVGELRRSSG